MPLVCRKSRQVFDSKHLRLNCKDRYMCPIQGHYNEELIEIDDLLIDPIFRLWKNNIGTLFCCSGHLHGEGNDTPYIMIGRDPLYKIEADDEKEKDPFENYFIVEKYRKIYDAAKQLVNTKYSRVLKYDPITLDSSTFNFDASRIQFSVRGQKGFSLLDAQKNLVDFCYDLAAESRRPSTRSAGTTIPDLKNMEFPWKKVNPIKYFKDLEEAAFAGECKKTYRGTVLLSPDLKILSTGTIKNCPPKGFPDCLSKKDFTCTSTHAEEDAIKKVIDNPEIKGIPKGSIMIHLKFDRIGNPTPSGEKYCTKCVPIMRENNIRYLVLYHKWGWAFYDLENLEETNLEAR